MASLPLASLSRLLTWKVLPSAGLLALTQTLDKASLLDPFVNYSRKESITLALSVSVKNLLFFVTDKKTN